MRYIALILFAVMHGSSWAQALTPEKLFENLSRSVWYVWGIDQYERRISQGSGVVVGPGKVVTNCHVLEKVRHIYVQRENVIYIAKLEHAETSRDLCQLDIKNFTAPAVTLGNTRDARVGQKVFALGNPLGLEGTFSEGMISALRGPDGKDPLIQTTAPFTSGSSGGGLFDSEGKLLGITTFIFKGSGNINFAVPVEWVREMDERMKAAEEKKKQLVAARAASAQGLALAPGMPAPGSTWKYRYRDRAFGGREAVLNISVSGVDGLVVREAMMVEGESAAGQLHASIAANEARFTERNLPGGVVLAEFSPYLLASADPEKGAWSAIPGMSTDGRPWRVTGRATGWENVTVPAGTFRALKVTVRGARDAEFRDPRLGQHDGLEFEYAAWYAEEARRVVRVQRKMYSAARVAVADETLELLKHDQR